MSTNHTEETPSNITTDAESQEYGAQHGQDIEGHNTGTSAPDADAEQRDGEDLKADAGTGARAGEYS